MPKQIRGPQAIEALVQAVLSLGSQSSALSRSYIAVVVVTIFLLHWIDRLHLLRLFYSSFLLAKQPTNKIHVVALRAHCAQCRHEEEVGPDPGKENRAEEEGPETREELQGAEEKQTRRAKRGEGT